MCVRACAQDRTAQNYIFNGSTYQCWKLFYFYTSVESTIEYFVFTVFT